MRCNTTTFVDLLWTIRCDHSWHLQLVCVTKASQNIFLHIKNRCYKYLQLKAFLHPISLWTIKVCTYSDIPAASTLDWQTICYYYFFFVRCVRFAIAHKQTSLVCKKVVTNTCVHSSNWIGTLTMLTVKKKRQKAKHSLKITGSSILAVSLFGLWSAILQAYAQLQHERGSFQPYDFRASWIVECNSKHARFTTHDLIRLFSLDKEHTLVFFQIKPYEPHTLSYWLPTWGNIGKALRRGDEAKYYISYKPK